MVVANWKMNKVGQDVLDFAGDFKRKLPRGTVEKVEAVICPAFVHLGLLTRDGALPTGVAVGAQDAHWKDKGAFTGCVSAAMLKDMKVRYAIVGHSERRQYFAESTVMLSDKLRAVLEFGLVPIFCVGESLADREAGKTMDILRSQMDSLGESLKLLPADPSDFVLAYEPVWAIGTGKNATVVEAQDVHRDLRRMLAKLWGEPRAGATRILYGGSVTPENFSELSVSPEIDGALVGGASLECDKFLKLIEIAAK